MTDIMFEVFSPCSKTLSNVFGLCLLFKETKQNFFFALDITLEFILFHSVYYRNDLRQPMTEIFTWTCRHSPMSNDWIIQQNTATTFTGTISQKSQCKKV